jgi:hypothetical protein
MRAIEPHVFADDTTKHCMRAVDVNLKAYELIFEVEVALREFLIARCEPIGGPRWYRAVLAQAQVSKLERLLEKRTGVTASDLRAKDDKKGWSSRRAFHPIYFVDFPELGEVFKKKSNALGEHLVGKRAESIADHVERLQPMRNAIAHNRPITMGDLRLAESIHAQIRTELGASDFEGLVSCPSITTTALEQTELLKELDSAIEAMKLGSEVQLAAWLRLRQRWWLESEWQLDAESVVDAFSLIAQYQEHWTAEIVGRRRRMQDWMTKHWREDLGRRAKASLVRDASLGEGIHQ